MNDLKVEKELLTAAKAARLAGTFLQENKKDINKILFSTEKDIKLKADIEAENIIKAVLKKESDIAILAEETGLSEECLPEVFWVVDPLDGTANYSRDIPICCVSIALVSKMEPLLGVIYDFNNDALFQGSVNTKAVCNEQAIEVSNISNPSEGILVTGLPNDTDYSNKALKKMIMDFQNWRKVRMIGSAAMASVYIASGKAEAYSETKTYLWDVAAGAALVNAAGGKAIILNQNDKFQVDVLFTNSSLQI
jgi:myo-inositol-1(or 4)-monophosphatase